MKHHQKISQHGLKYFLTVTSTCFLILFVKAKVKPLWNTIKKVRAENGFSKLLEETISNEVAYAIEEYTCSMYHFRCDENIMDKNNKNF